MDDRPNPQQESWWLGCLKFQSTFFLAVLAGVAYQFAPNFLNHFFPRLGIYISVALFWTIAILVVITLVRGLLKVFRPDDPADLSLK